MNELVFLTSNKIDATPFTTSEIIAEYAGIKHHAVQQLVTKYEPNLKQFGVIAFEMRKPPKGSAGGRPQLIYHLTEEQATLLITFLQNTEPVVAFKTELVRQFYIMKAELFQRQMRRMQLKPIRREMTDAIQDDPNHSKWDFKLYTDLAYKAVLGKNAAQIRKERGAPKTAVAVDYMTADEIAAVSKKQYQISALIELGMDYYQVKSILLERQVLGKIA